MADEKNPSGPSENDGTQNPDGTLAAGGKSEADAKAAEKHAREQKKLENEQIKRLEADAKARQEELQSIREENAKMAEQLADVRATINRAAEIQAQMLQQGMMNMDAMEASELQALRVSAANADAKRAQDAGETPAQRVLPQEGGDTGMPNRRDDILRTTTPVEPVNFKIDHVSAMPYEAYRNMMETQARFDALANPLDESPGGGRFMTYEGVLIDHNGVPIKE